MIRKATIADFDYIRKMPVQFTARPVTALQPKHFRVLVQETAVRLLVFQGRQAPGAFLALRFSSVTNCANRSLSIVHLGLNRYASGQGVAAAMEEQAITIAREHQCAALLVKAEPLSVSATTFYRERGYVLKDGVYIKTL